jgi:hypothetical protein
MYDDALTLADIELVVTALKNGGDDDPESSHYREDRLLKDVLEFIASGKCPDPAAFAQSALRTKEARFAMVLVVVRASSFSCCSPFAGSIL